MPVLWRLSGYFYRPGEALGRTYGQVGTVSAAGGGVVEWLQHPGRAQHSGGGRQLVDPPVQSKQFCLGQEQPLPGLSPWSAGAPDATVGAARNQRAAGS